jgi:uncharacterized membrane protein SpoIIM required for sporulation
MLEKMAGVWLISRRELRDQFRDWRILLPQIILILAFPLLMNQVAKGAVAFVNQYGANLIVDRLVPFSVLIIGFFPMTVSLVVALESFVGEKERGTIEPLLSSPLENWQMYFGKLLIGIFIPLIASYISIGLYLLVVSRQQISMPPGSTFFQLFLLTTAHAILMVSAAIVISVQSTTVKAANLLASFIVIPVAVLMQGETVLLFWGNDQVLWYAVVAVFIMAVLLIRVGISHFQREYLLGRELDSINLRWIGRTFWAAFRGQARSLGGWYRLEVRKSLGRLAVPILFMVVIAVLAYMAGFAWVTVNVPRMLTHAGPQDIRDLVADVRRSPGLTQLGSELSAPFIFLHNVRAAATIFVAGLISFSVLGMLAFLANIGVIGGVLGMFKLAGVPPGQLFLVGILPHGLFELPALIIASAAVLRMGVALVTPQMGKSMGEVMLDLIADWARVFLGVVVPLLAVAAVIEAYVTPQLLHTLGK